VILLENVCKVVKKLKTMAMDLFSFGLMLS